MPNTPINGDNENSIKQLFFDYPSTAKIRFKLSNMYQDNKYPKVYRIKTEKLDFLVPRIMVIISKKKKQVFIPLAYYRDVITQYSLTAK